MMTKEDKAIIRWWKAFKPMDWSFEQFAKNPTANISQELHHSAIKASKLWVARTRAKKAKPLKDQFSRQRDEYFSQVASVRSTFKNWV